MAGIFGKIFGKEPKKLGLGLGGGGAKGSVHLGALKAFYEEGITFDAVAGTSIGSIVGGLYAAGYGAGEIESMIKTGGFTDVKRLVAARLTGHGVDDVVAALLHGLDFCDLRIPFAAVAVDLDSGEEAVFTEKSGVNLAKALGASSAIAPYFNAVSESGHRYVDGAYRNIIPCDVVKSLGADVVIGIDLSCHRRSTENGKRTLDEMCPKNGVPVCDPTAAGYAACDIMITPDLERFTSTGFGAIDEMFDVGYFAAKEKMGDVLALLKRNKIKFGKK